MKKPASFPTPSLLHPRFSRRSFLAAQLGLGAGFALGGFAGLPAAVLAARSRRTFYVAPYGDDRDPGSEERPFKTITGALRSIPRIGANDTVIVKPGTYREQVIIRRGGSAEGYFRLVSEKPHGAKIRCPARPHSAIAILRSYVEINGFDVTGDQEGHGIEATFIDGDPKKGAPHHIRALNNLSYDNAGSGIGFAYGDFYHIENNICFGNCATNKYQGSGISIYAPHQIGDAKPELRCYVGGNMSFNNMAIDLPGDPEPPHSDGNGIIIDDLKGTQKPHPSGPYRHFTLVENNLCYRNGGRGIHVFISDYVTVRNNTCAHNNRDPLNVGKWRGELSNVASSHVRWINNLAIADPEDNADNTAILEGGWDDLQCKDIVWRNNLTYNGRPGDQSVKLVRPLAGLFYEAPGPKHLLGVDPGVALDETKGNIAGLRPGAGSPAIDAGTAEYGHSERDLALAKRISGKTIDIGAYEFQND